MPRNVDPSEEAFANSMPPRNQPMGMPIQQDMLPERHIEKIIPRLLPSGRLFQFYDIVETVVEPPLRYVTRHYRGVEPGLSCSCYPTSEYDISECSNQRCLAVTCLRHSDACPFCGGIYCTQCLTCVQKEGAPIVVCRSCQRRLTGPLIIRLLKRLFGIQHVYRVF